MTKETTTKDNSLIISTGRRKTAVARVFLYQKKGDFTVNDKAISDHFLTEKQEISWKRPFHTIGVAHPDAQFSATIKVNGAGPNAQLEAIIHGFARALAEISSEYRTLLSRAGLLRRDPRMVERKKYYLRKARKAPQYSKR